MNYSEMVSFLLKLEPQIDDTEKGLNEHHPDGPIAPKKRVYVYHNPKECPMCHIGRLRKVKAGRYGRYFIGCSRYPACRFTRST